VKLEVVSWRSIFRLVFSISISKIFVQCSYYFVIFLCFATRYFAEYLCTSQELLQLSKDRSEISKLLR